MAFLEVAIEVRCKEEHIRAIAYCAFPGGWRLVKVPEVVAKPVFRG